MIKSIKVKDLKKRALLYKWLAEDLSEEFGTTDEVEEFWSVCYFVKISNNFYVFYSRIHEDRTVTFNSIDSDASLDNVFLIEPKNNLYPYRKYGQNKVHRAMLISIFKKGDDIDVEKR